MNSITPSFVILSVLGWAASVVFLCEFNRINRLRIEGFLNNFGKTLISPAKQIIRTFYKIEDGHLYRWDVYDDHEERRIIPLDDIPVSISGGVIQMVITQSGGLWFIYEHQVTKSDSNLGKAIALEDGVCYFDSGEVIFEYPQNPVDDKIHIFMDRILSKAKQLNLTVARVKRLYYEKGIKHWPLKGNSKEIVDKRLAEQSNLYPTLG